MTPAPEFVRWLFGPGERRAMRRGGIWAWIAFCLVFGFWAALDAFVAGLIEGAVFAWLAFVAGFLTALRRTHGSA